MASSSHVRKQRLSASEVGGFVLEELKLPSHLQARRSEMRSRSERGSLPRVAVSDGSAPSERRARLVSRLAGEGRAPLVGAVLGAALLVLAVISARTGPESSAAPPAHAAAGAFPGRPDSVPDPSSLDSGARHAADTSGPVVTFAIDPMLIPEPRRPVDAESASLGSSARGSRANGSSGPLSNSVLERPIAPPEE